MLIFLRSKSYKVYIGDRSITWTWPWWMSSNSAGALSLDNERVVSFFRRRLCMVRNRPLGNRLLWWATDSSSTTSPSDSNCDRLLHRLSVGESSVIEKKKQERYQFVLVTLIKIENSNEYNRVKTNSTAKNGRNLLSGSSRNRTYDSGPANGLLVTDDDRTLPMASRTVDNRNHR